MRIRSLIRIRSDSKLFAGSGSEVGSGIKNFETGSGQLLSGMNLKQNLSDKIDNFSTRFCIRFPIRYLYISFRYPQIGHTVISLTYASNKRSQLLNYFRNTNLWFSIHDKCSHTQIPYCKHTEKSRGDVPFKQQIFICVTKLFIQPDFALISRAWNGSLGPNGMSHTWKNHFKFHICQESIKMIYRRLGFLAVVWFGSSPRMTLS